MQESVVVSGKGGTVKTSLVAAFAALAERKILVDCDSVTITIRRSRGRRS